MSVRLPNAQQVYHCFTQLAGLGARGRSMTFVPPRCTTPRTIVMDSVRYPGFGYRGPKIVHSRNGNLATLWYKACHPPTQAQLDAAHRAVVIQGIPRNRYTGRLVDVWIQKTGPKAGTLYALLMDVQERDVVGKVTKGVTPYRMMNLDDGNLFRAFIDAGLASKPKPSAVKAYAKVLAKVTGKQTKHKVKP